MLPTNDYRPSTATATGENGDAFWEIQGYCAMQPACIVP